MSQVIDDFCRALASSGAVTREQAEDMRALFTNHMDVGWNDMFGALGVGNCIPTLMLIC